jgi:hypothetical protein
VARCPAQQGEFSHDRPLRDDELLPPRRFVVRCDADPPAGNEQKAVRGVTRRHEHHAGRGRHGCQQVREPPQVLRRRIGQQLAPGQVCDHPVAVDASAGGAVAH